MTLDADTHTRINDYYNATLERSGPSPQGVDWNSTFAHEERFRQVLRIVDIGDAYKLLDYGCGYGALLDYLLGADVPVSRYTGFDVTEVMISRARSLFAGEERATFTTDRAELVPADYVVASGIFNIRFIDDPIAWTRHIDETLDDMDSLATRGFAFNMLTSYSDPERMRADLFYGNPHRYFEYCRKFSRNVAIIHDYDLYDFTILVRKTLPPRYTTR